MVADLSGCRQTIVIHKLYRDATGSISKAAVLQQILYWSGIKGDGEWWYKTYSELADEAGVSESTAKRAVEYLKAEGLLETDVRHANGIPTVHYRLSILRFEEWIRSKWPNGKGQNDLMEKVKMTESHSLTENTTENTTDRSTPLTPLISQNLKNETQDDPGGHLDLNSVSDTRENLTQYGWSEWYDPFYLDLDSHFEVVAKSSYTRVRRIRWKPAKWESPLSRFKSIEHDIGRIEARLRFLRFLDDNNTWLKDNYWPFDFFVTHHHQYASRKPYRMPAKKADPDRYSISTGGEAPTVPPNASEGNTTQNVGYQWYVNKWNELVPMRAVRHLEAYAGEFSDPVMTAAWEEICQKAARRLDELNSAGKDTGWLTLDWMLKLSKEGRPNWRPILAQGEVRKKRQIKDGKFV